MARTVLLSQSQMPALASSEMVGGQGGFAYWAVGHGLVSPDPRWTSKYRDRPTTTKHPDGHTRADERADAVVVLVES